MRLYPRRKLFTYKVVILLPDGSLDVEGEIFGTPRAAAKSITGKPQRGLHFFLVDQTTGRSLRDVHREYVDSLSDDTDDDSADEDGEE